GDRKCGRAAEAGADRESSQQGPTARVARPVRRVRRRVASPEQSLRARHRSRPVVPRHDVVLSPGPRAPGKRRGRRAETAPDPARVKKGTFRFSREWTLATARRGGEKRNVPYS